MLIIDKYNFNFELVQIEIYQNLKSFRLSAKCKIVQYHLEVTKLKI